MSGDGVQAADLKRVGKAEPKVYVHKDGKTIMIPAEKKDEYMAKGYKLSSLRAESAMTNYGDYLDMEFKRQNKYKDIHDFECLSEHACTKVIFGNIVDVSYIVRNKKEDYKCALSNKGEAQESWDIIEEILKST